MDTPPIHLLETYPWLKEVPALDPNSFTFEEHEMDNSFLCMRIMPENWICLGWANASTIPVRPRAGMLAVRFADLDTGKEFWLHVA
jgi:hypothetical protein